MIIISIIFMASKQPVSFRLANGDTFSGNLNFNNQGFQEGQYIYAGEDKYSGEFQQGMKHGFGTYHYAQTGEKYEGEWKNDVWDGKGTYSVGIPPEVVIKGRWERGLLNGEAEIIHKNKDHFKG